jgi:hypothetical protein
MKENNNEFDAIARERDEVLRKCKLINAMATKEIWSDSSYDKYAYNQRETLRRAELTIRETTNPEYQELLRKLNDLSLKMRTIDEDFTYPDNPYFLI